MNGKLTLVYWNRDYEPGAIERDRLVQQRLGKLGVAVRTFKDHVVFEALRYGAGRVSHCNGIAPIAPVGGPNGSR